MMMFDDKVGGWGWLNDDVIFLTILVKIVKKSVPTCGVQICAEVDGSNIFVHHKNMWGQFFSQF